MTAPETEADREHLRRVLDTANKHFHEAGACFVKAKGYVREGLTCLAKGDYDGAQDFYEMASEKALCSTVWPPTSSWVGGSERRSRSDTGDWTQVGTTQW